jgi:hypothetical protein
MNENLLVVFQGKTRPVVIDGETCGTTNTILSIPAGLHDVTLGGQANYHPIMQRVRLTATSVNSPKVVTFT